MDRTLTLIADNGLNDSILIQARSALADHGADTGLPVWLAAGSAADIPYGRLPDDRAEAAARQAVDGLPVDLVAQATAERRKLLLVADMDSTIVTGETLDELADFAGLKPHIAAITARAMNGELDFPTALRERVGLLKGLSADSLEKAYRRITLTGGARTLVATMRGHGAFTVLVSGGFRFFTTRVRELCGFDRDLANQLEIADGQLTGRVLDPILDRDTKLQTLVGVAGERRLPLSLTLAVGDGANDLAMIQAAGLGVAFHAKPVVAAAARVRIDHGDLTALLFAQGYRRDQFVG
jgi:phosphoserine phosphatase